MRVLHTSDWHVGKAIRGRSRAAEHQAVLTEIAAVAERESADLVIVAGDLFDTATPTPESERIVYRALLDLAAGGRPVVVIAGNHDSSGRLAAVAPLSEASGVYVASSIRPPDDGGVVELKVDGVTALVALLPFPSQRYVVTADLLMSANDATVAHAAYADRVGRILRALTGGFGASTVNLVAAHLMVLGGTMGGGERGAHTVFDYWVPATAFPSSAQYVALGHLHRAQRLDGPAPLHYCGSPLQLDFGETANQPVVNLVDLRPGLPAEVRPVELTAGQRLRTLKGPLDQLREHVGTTGDDHLRLVLDEPSRIGLADEARELFPTAVEVVLATRDEQDPAGPPDRDTDRLQRTPHELLAAYLDEREANDPRILALFDNLVEDLTDTSDTPADADPTPPGSPAHPRSSAASQPSRASRSSPATAADPTGADAPTAAEGGDADASAAGDGVVEGSAPGSPASRPSRASRTRAAAAGPIGTAGADAPTVVDGGDADAPAGADGASGGAAAGSDGGVVEASLFDVEVGS